MFRILVALTLLLVPSLGFAQNLVERGRDLFENETFGGNGRTCATCHPLALNTTLSPSDIARLPDNDPLFVAEFVPGLARQGNLVFEVPELMRGRGLICENLDGFDRPCVMRAIMHTLALRTTIEPELRDDSPVVTHHLGWSGDGSPLDGSLRSFAVGAVIQHFPRTLNRVEGVDFRLPTNAELDALEAFQLSLGRQRDVNLSQLRFRDPVIQAGLELFVTDNEGPNGDPTSVDCQNCHNNAGANNRDGLNPLNSTAVEDARGRPIGTILEAAGINLPGPGLFPRDAGAGRGPSPLGGFGIDRMNSQPLIEAADTAPFFHDNSCMTLECAVSHYTSSAFRGDSATRALIDLSATEVEQIAAFLRAMNALENLRAARAQLESGFTGEPVAQARRELSDAIRVLTEGGLLPRTVDALVELRDATRNGQGNVRRTLAGISAIEDQILR